MKKSLKLVLTLVLSLCMVTACTSHTNNHSKQTSTATKTSTKVTSSSSSKSSASSSSVSLESQPSSTEASSTQVEQEIAPIYTGAILKADYATMAGNWQNASGNVLTFNNTGLATEEMTPNILDIDQNGILLLDVQTGARSNVTLYIIPAGTAFSSDYLNGQSDPTDVSKDRVISSADINSGDLANKAYYHVSQ